jgi:hypothetical protein
VVGLDRRVRVLGVERGGAEQQEADARGRRDQRPARAHQLDVAVLGEEIRAGVARGVVRVLAPRAGRLDARELGGQRGERPVRGVGEGGGEGRAHRSTKGGVKRASRGSSAPSTAAAVASIGAASPPRAAPSR